MPEDQSTYRHAPSNIFGELSSLKEISLGAGPDFSLGCVNVAIDGVGPGGHSVILAPPHALELAHSLLGAVMRLRRAEPEPGPGGLSSRY